MNRLIIYVVLLVLLLANTRCANYHAARTSFKQKQVEWRAEEQRWVIEKYKRKIRESKKQKPKVHPIGKVIVVGVLVIAGVIIYNQNHDK